MATTFDINKPETYNHQSVQFDNKTYRLLDYVEQGPKEAQTILLLHGFPESWYTWKYQIDYLSNLGYHVIAFDMPGYGKTLVEDKLENYTFKTVAEDIYYIFTQHFKQNKLIIIGHDWGSLIGWELAYRYPQNIIAYISLNIPYVPNLYEPMTERQKAEKYPIIGYQVALNEGNVKEWDNDVERFLKCFWVINKNMTEGGFNLIPLNQSLYEHHDLLDKSDFKYPEDNFMNYLIEQYKIQGTKGPTNWYRTSYLNGLNDQQKPHHDITVKCLQILGTTDLGSPFKDFGKQYTKDISTEIVEGGHWIHFLNSSVVNPIIGNFLKGLEK